MQGVISELLLRGSGTNAEDPKAVIHDLCSTLHAPPPEYSTEDLEAERLTEDQARFLCTLHLPSLPGLPGSSGLEENWFQVGDGHKCWFSFMLVVQCSAAVVACFLFVDLFLGARRGPF